MNQPVPEDVAASVKEWETAILRLQVPVTVDYLIRVVVDPLIASKQAQLAATGAPVSIADNPLGSRTQYGLQQSIQTLNDVRAKILTAAKEGVPLAAVTYEPEADIEDEE